MQYHFHMRQTAFQPENGLYDQRKKCHMPEPPFRASPDLTSHKNNSGIYFRIPHCGVITWTALLSIRHRLHYPAAAEDRKPPEDIIKEPPRMGRFFLSKTRQRRTRNHKPSYGLSSRVRLRKVWWCLWDSNPYSVSGSGFSCRSMLPWPRGARVAVWTLSSPYCPSGNPGGRCIVSTRSGAMRRLRSGLSRRGSFPELAAIHPEVSRPDAQIV